jgi:chromate transport protein ChrA
MSKSSFYEITRAYIPLSVISFGGPTAHVALFYDYFVKEKCWINEKVFSELFSISQALPGPGSTQLGYAIALLRYVCHMSNRKGRDLSSLRITHLFYEVCLALYS